MFNDKNNDFKYSNDLKIKEIRMIIKIIGSYLLLLFLWQYTLSFQSSMYTLMNVCVFAMFAFGAIGLFVCREEQETIIKHTKKQIIYYLVVIFCYDLFFKIILNDMMVGQTLGEVDGALVVARQWIMTLSTILKIGFPMAYIVWMLQKFGIFKAGMSKKRQMERLRDVRENTKRKMPSREDNIDRF